MVSPAPSGEGAAQSLWQATARIPAPAFAALDRDVEADVAIVGAGYTGLSAALRLAQAGRSVALLESGRVGEGASGRNGGQVNPGLKHSEAELTARFGAAAGRAFFRLGEEAADALAQTIGELGIDCAFRRPGVLRLAHTPGALAGLRTAGRDLAARGVAARLLDASETAQAVGSRRYAGALLDPRGGSLQPLDLARGLALAAHRAGARIFEGTRARSLRDEGGRWRLGCGPHAVLAREVVVATNGYTGGLVPGLARSLVPVNSFQIATGPAGDAAAAILPGGEAAYDSRRLILYFRRAPNGAVVLGGRASFLSHEGLTGPRRDHRVLARVLEDLFPALAPVRPAYAWTGLVCITPDHLPHYHRPADGLHVAVGYNGRGVALAHRVGLWLGDALAGRPDAGALPATPIRPIPLHAFRAPAANLVMQWNRLLDAVGR